MTYTHGSYKLYKKNVILKSGYKHTIYFFSSKQPKSGTLCDMPEGYEVGVNKKTNMPYLKYAGNRHSKWQDIKKSKRR